MRRADASSSVSTLSDDNCAACSVISAVTFGLPSRSPPIHEPSRANARTAGAVVPAASASSQSSRRRYTSGRVSASVDSKTLSTVRTSSRTVGLASRSGAVRHSVSISPSSLRSFSASDMPPTLRESRSATSSAIRRIEAETARRRASVGCAVRTGRNSISASRWRATSCADLLRELRDRGRQGVVRGQVVRQEARLTLAQHADAVVLLGGVGQVEVARERPGDLLGTGRA